MSDFNPSCIGRRSDVERLLPDGVRSVLDRVLVGDATAVIDGIELEGMQFDAIIFADVLELFRAADLSIVSVDANYRLVERPHRINRFAKYFVLPGLRGFLAFQNLVTAPPAAKRGR